jgi:hypothetical protein
MGPASDRVILDARQYLLIADAITIAEVRNGIVFVLGSGFMPAQFARREPQKLW